MTIHFEVKMASKTALFSYMNELYIFNDCHKSDWLIYIWLCKNTPIMKNLFCHIYTNKIFILKEIKILFTIII